MNTVALLIVLTSAFLHATWNLLLKRANGGDALMWLIFVCMVVVSAPVAAIIVITQHPMIGGREIIAIVGNGVLQMTYFILLNQSYRFGDLSLVYPLARGSGPLIVTVVAILFLGETPTPLAVGGAVMIAVGVLLLSANLTELRKDGAMKGVVFALMTGATIASYTLWDQYAVHDLDLNPLLYLFAGGIVQMVLFIPFVLRKRDQVIEQWHTHWRSALLIGTLSFAAYALVLFALTFTQVSYIAPAREVSVMIGFLMGGRVLAEQMSTRRIVAAAAMLLGMIGLALG
jgi:drug/metabolite transporter (DMT)-like permease